jgi:FMN phosphatase YigB (HAD superfamily)
MARALSLSDAAEHFGIKISADRMAEIQGALEAELDSIEAFEDGIRAVERLQAEGIKIAIASNLAALTQLCTQTWMPMASVSLLEP